MGSARGAPTTARGTVSKLLAIGPSSSVKFFAALRRLESHFRTAPRLSEAAHPDEEPVRLTQDPSLAFRASAVTSFVEGSADTPARVSVGFFGAFGPHGSLPTHLTEYAEGRRRHQGDGALIGFFDIFHHRLLSLLFRAWANAQPTVSHDRPESDSFARQLGALIGLTTALGPHPFGELDYACLYTAGHFVGQTRHSEGLAKVIHACFKVEAKIEEFVGHWLTIPDDSCWRIPSSDPSGGSSIGVLGESSRIGTQLWEQQSNFGVTLGPLGRADYERFVPGGPSLSPLLELVERYAGPELGFHVRLVLREPERRAAVLGMMGRVGITTHLGGGGGEGVLGVAFDDLVLDPSHVSR